MGKKLISRRPAADLVASRLVPDELWEIVVELIPKGATRPQGGGRARVDDRSLFVGMVYVLAQDIAWRRLPREFNVAYPTMYRRYCELSALGFWSQLRDRCDRATEWGDWAHELANRADQRVPERDPLTLRIDQR